MRWVALDDGAVIGGHLLAIISHETYDSSRRCSATAQTLRAVTRSLGAWTIVLSASIAAH
jgi:hypothetical protein